MPYKFEKLEIWKLAIVFANDVHLLTRKFPKEEMFNLTSQFKRAADSISLNISEGSIRQSDPEQKKFLGYAIRSISECVTCLYLSEIILQKKNLLPFINVQKRYLQRQTNLETD